MTRAILRWKALGGNAYLATRIFQVAVGIPRHVRVCILISVEQASRFERLFQILLSSDNKGAKDSISQFSITSIALGIHKRVSN